MFMKYAYILSEIISEGRSQVLCKRVKSAYEPIVVHQAGAYPGFYNMKRLGVFLLPPPPGWDASPSQSYPQALKCTYGQNVFLGFHYL